MTQPPFISIPCPGDTVQLEMLCEVPGIASGEKLTWSTAGKQRFIHRQHGEYTFDDDGEIVSQGPYQVTAYHAVPGFDVTPYGVQFYPPEPESICVLESVVNRDQEQFTQPNFGFEVFRVCQFEPLHVAWPTFNQEHPLLLRFFNPIEKELPPFTLSFFVSAPKDFADRWIKNE